jgi:hypothetical protein
MSRALLAVLVLVAISSAQKVKVDLYFESLCPDCEKFITTSLRTAANTQVRHC